MRHRAVTQLSCRVEEIITIRNKSFSEVKKNVADMVGGKKSQWEWNGVHLCVCVLVSVQFLGIKQSDGSGEEAVKQSVREDPNAPVPFARWQEGEEFA